VCLAANYSKTSFPVLTVDGCATVIEAALKGYDKWRTSRNRTPEEVSYEFRGPQCWKVSDADVEGTGRSSRGVL
jgi:hypothetical protein